MYAIFTTWLLVRAVGQQPPAVPNPPAAPPPGFGDKINIFLGWLKWGGLAAGVGGLIACGIMMSVGQRNRHSLSADGAAGVPWALAGVSLVVTAAALVGAFL